MLDSKTRFREIFFRSDPGAKYLFLSAFLFNAAFIPFSIILSLTKSPLSPIAGMAINLLSGLITFFFIILYFRSVSSRPSTHLGKNIVNGILNTMTCMIFLLGVSLSFSTIMSHIFDTISNMLSGHQLQNLIIILAGYILLLIFIQFLLLAGALLTISAFEYSLSPSSLGSAFIGICARLLKRFWVMLVYMIVIFLLNLILMPLLQQVSGILDNIVPTAFLENYFNCIIKGAVYGYILFILAGMVRFLFSGVSGSAGNIKFTAGNMPPGNVPAEKPDIANNTASDNTLPFVRIINKLPVFSIISIVIFALSYIFSPLKAAADPVSTILSEAQLEFKLGDAIEEGGVPVLQINHYDIACSYLLACKGFLMGIEALRYNDTSMYQDAFDNLSKASAAYPENKYIQFFTGKLRSIENKNDTDTSLALFKLSAQHSDFLPESYLGLLKGYAAKNDTTGLKSTLSYLIDAELFFDKFEAVTKLSNRKIEANIAKIDSMQINADANQLLKALEKNKYNDYAGALADVQLLAQKYPDQELFQYYISEFANKVRNEQSNYPLVKSSAEKYANMIDLDKHPEEAVTKELFKAEMQLNADDKIAAEKTLYELYRNNASNTQVAEKYADILTINNKNQEAIEVCERLLKEQPDSTSAMYSITMAQMGLKDYSKSLAAMQVYCKTAKEAVRTSAPDDLAKKQSTYDYYLNRYALRYCMTLDDPASAAALEAINGDIVLYNYIIGMRFWQQRDNAKSIEAMNKVVKEDSNLGYAYFHIAVNYHENIKAIGGTDYSTPVMYYLKSLELQPEHAEGYFSLGHCFKDWKRYKEALSAFRRVVDIWPYQDHVIDTFGISVHTGGQIGELQQYDELGVK